MSNSHANNGFTRCVVTLQGALYKTLRVKLGSSGAATRILAAQVEEGNQVVSSGLLHKAGAEQVFTFYNDGELWLVSFEESGGAALTADHAGSTNISMGNAALSVEVQPFDGEGDSREAKTDAKTKIPDEV